MCKTRFQLSIDAVRKRVDGKGATIAALFGLAMCAVVAATHCIARTMAINRQGRTTDINTAATATAATATAATATAAAAAAAVKATMF